MALPCQTTVNGSNFNQQSITALTPTLPFHHGGIDSPFLSGVLYALLIWHSAPATWSAISV